MKLVISLILILVLIYFCYSINIKQHFQNSLPSNTINFDRGSHIVFQKNLFYKIGDKTKDILTNNFKNKIDFDKNNLVLPSGFTIKDKLCIDNVCVKANNLQQFIEPDVTPKFYKECKNYKRSLKSTESASTNTNWKDKNNNKCEWYEADPIRCQQSDDTMPGPGSDFNGIGAKDACCICKSSTDITNLQDLKDNKYYTKLNYNNDSKITKPDYLCMNDDEYIIVYSDKRPITSGDILGRLKKQSNLIESRPHWKSTSPNLHLKYDKKKWVISGSGIDDLHSQPTKLMKPNNTLIWKTTANETKPIKISYNQTCINGQNFRTINGSKTINIRSDWDNYPDYIRPYNVEVGDGNKASGVRDYVFFHKDNDIDNNFVNYSDNYPGSPGIRICSENINTKMDNTPRGNCLISPGGITYIGIDPNNNRTNIKKYNPNLWEIKGIKNYYFNETSKHNVPIGGSREGWRVSVNNNGPGAKYNHVGGRWDCSLRSGRGDGDSHMDAPMRLNEDGDVECYSHNGIWCTWHQCYENQHGVGWWNARNRLKCGKYHEYFYKHTGYDNTNHWCHRAATKWGHLHNMTIKQDPTDRTVIIVSGHVPRLGDSDNVNGRYKTEDLGEHYCEKAGISKNIDKSTHNDYGLDYIILPGKKSRDSLTNIDKYKHIHSHEHDNESHSMI